MKKYVLLTVLIIPVALCAQVRKGQWLAGGNGLFSYSKSKDLAFTSVQLAPAAGYFLGDRFALGFRAGFASDTYKWEQDKFRTSTLTVAPFLRCYFLQADEKVNYFADASFGYAWSKDRHFEAVGSYSYHAYNAALMVGSAIFLNEHTALEITAGYNYLSRGPSDTTVTSKFQVGIGFQIHLGK